MRALGVLFRKSEVHRSGELLDRAFELASFVVPNRKAALNTLIRALHKLDTLCTAEEKRAYWRDKYLKRRISRISRPKADILQWLILLESDEWEQHQEQNEAPQTRELVIRYIKYLVRLSTPMSAFYVNIAISRFLYSYSTSEAQNIYELLTQHYVGKDEYRRSKALLISKIIERFGKFLRVVKGPHGERKFSSRSDSDCWLILTHECLSRFTPWSTAGRCSHRHLVHGSLPGEEPITNNCSGSSDPNALELCQCHTLVHPSCYKALVAELGLESPERKLSLPAFESHDEPSGPEGSSRKFESLAEHEHEMIKDILMAESERRRGIVPGVVKLIVDGVERKACRHSDGPSFYEIHTGDQLIEIRMIEEDTDVLIGTYLVVFDVECGIIPQSFSVPVGNRHKLTVEIAPASGHLPATSAFASVQYRETGWLSSIGRIFDRQPRFRLDPRFAFLMAMVFLFSSYFIFSGYQNRLNSERKLAANLRAELAMERASKLGLAQLSPTPHVPRYRLNPDERAVRGEGDAGFPTVILPSTPAILGLELPLDRLIPRRAYRGTLKEFSSSHAIINEDLQVTGTATAPTVTFLVPSSLLKPDLDYMIDVAEDPTRIGHILHTYSFHTVSSR